MKEQDMAITWTLDITNVNRTSGRGDITATRTDSASALAPRVYKMNSTPIATSEQRLRVLATIKEWDEAAVVENSALETFLSDLGQFAIANLNAWELTR